MREKFKIPEMDIKEICKWYQTIKPIIRINGKPYFLRKLSKNELVNKAYTWLPQRWSKPVNFEEMELLLETNMLHTYGYYGFFKPSVGEVIRQIPKELLDKVIGFEIVNEVGMGNEQYKEQFNDGYHVSLIRLYGKKN